MITIDDKMFLVLYSCLDSISVKRLSYYMYIFQKADVDFNFRYKLSASGFMSSSLSDYIDSLISDDILTSNGNLLDISEIGNTVYDGFLLTYDYIEHFNELKGVLDSFTESELLFICLCDFLIDDVRERKGVDGLVSSESEIKNTLLNLSDEYSQDNFNAAIKLISSIKRWN